MFPVAKRRDSSRGAGLPSTTLSHSKTHPHSSKPRGRETKRTVTATNPSNLDRRSLRIADALDDLYHNAHYRGRFTSGTIIGWYTHPSLWTAWANRPFRAYRRIYKKTGQRLPRLPAATRSRYQQLVQGYISTDFILSEYEKGLLRGGFARDGAVAAAASSREESREERTDETPLQAILRALKPAALAAPEASAFHPHRLAMEDDGDERLPVGTDYDVVLKAHRQQTHAERHNRRLEREVVSDTGESMWKKPGEDCEFFGEAEGRAGGMLY